MNTGRIEKIFLLLFIALISGGCSSFVKDGQPLAANTEAILQAGMTVGQSFVARDGGLNGVEIFIAPDAPGDGTLRLHLRDDPTALDDRSIASLPIQQVSAPGYYRFEFAPREDSFQHAYYFFLDVEGAGRVKVSAAPGDAYLDGAMYRNGEAVDAQTSFRLAYELWGLARALVRQGVTWLGIIALAIFLYVLPGLALLIGLWHDAERLSWGEKLGLSAGISLALYPLLLLWTHLFALQLGALYAWLPPLGAFAFLGWHYRDPGWRASLANALREWRRSDAFLPDSLLIFFIALILFTRFWAIRSLDVPMWGDSLHHTMIAQLMVDNGGLFDSWEPYAAIQSLTYHFGFHTDSAVWAWMSSFAMPQAVLWTGQIFNALAVIALYPLAVRVGGNRWAGVGAVLIAGLLVPMPMYYSNWGRYTQLAGQAILPAAVIISWVALESPKRDWRLTMLAWIVIGGLALTHYRILIFYVLFIAAFFCFRVNLQKLQNLIVEIWVVGIGGFLLFLPWLVHLLGSVTAQIFSKEITTSAEATPVFIQQYNSIGDLFFFLPAWIWLLFIISMALCLWQNQSVAALLSVWWLLVLLAANPQWLNLPGQGALSNFAFFIAAYIPAGVLIGTAFAEFIHRINVDRGRNIALLGILLTLALTGALDRLANVNAFQGALATSADLRATDWIRHNTPRNARFLVNSFFAYGDSVIVGSDGGWWLPLLSLRQTTLPPINYASERGPRSDYREWINALTTEIQTKGIASPDVVTSLRSRDVTHVYVGQRQGRVNYNGLFVFKPEELVASPYFHPVYHEDRVWVFELAR